MGIIIIFVLLFMGAALFKLYKTPIDISFIKPALLSTINTEDTPYSVDFGNLVITWNQFEGPIKLQGITMSLKSAGQNVFSVEKADLFLDGKALIRGKLAIDEIILYNPVAYIDRDEENNFTVNIANAETTALAPEPAPSKEADADTDFAKDLIDLLLTPEKEAVKSAANWGYLDRIEIKDASIIVSDRKNHMTWFLPQINAAINRWDKGLNAKIDLDLAPYSEERENLINTEVSFERNTDKIEAKINVENFDPSILSRYIRELEPLRSQDARINGRFTTILDTKFNLDNAVLDLSIPELNLNLPDQYDEKKRINDIVVSGFYDALDKNFQFDLRSMEVAQTTLSGKIFGTYEGADYTIKTQIDTDKLPLDFFDEYWPNSLKAESAAQWLTQKLSIGSFSDVIGTAEFNYNTQSRDFASRDLRLDFAFKDIDIDYRPPLMPVHSAQGTGFLTLDKIDLSVEKAMVQDLKLSNAHVLLDDIFVVGGGMATIGLTLDGTLPTIFEYISREPIDLGSALGFKPQETKGQATVNVKLNFPTIKDLLAEQVNVEVSADLDKVLIPNAVKNFPLTGGPFKLNYADKILALKGDGILLKHPIKIDWTRYVEESEHKNFSVVKASFNATPKLRDAFGINLDEFINGTPPVEIEYNLTKGNNATIDAKIDLTPLEFMVQPFSYSKPPKIKGQASARIILKGGEIQEIDRLSISTPDASVKNARLKFGKLGKEWDVKTGTFTNTKLLKNKFDLKLERQTPTAMRFNIDAEYLDLLPFLSFKDKDNTQDKDSTSKKSAQKAEPSIEVFAKAKTLNTSKKGGHLNNAIGYIKLSADNIIEQMELDALSGESAVYLRYKPEQGSETMDFRLEADNAGSFLRAFDLYNNVIDGTIVIHGKAAKHGHPNDIKGFAVIDDFMVINAPSLARLLNAMTLTGMEDLLTAEGINFDRLESNIKWLITDEGIRFNFDKGRTSGGALGLTFQGNIYQGSRDEIDLNGTIIPISPINKLVSKIPLLGHILTGGENQGIFAATYKIKGSSADAKTSVNPLSVLAPGILRRILFESGTGEE